MAIQTFERITEAFETIIGRKRTRFNEELGMSFNGEGKLDDRTIESIYVKRDANTDLEDQYFNDEDTTLVQHYRNLDNTKSRFESYVNNFINETPIEIFKGGVHLKKATRKVKKFGQKGMWVEEYDKPVKGVEYLGEFNVSDVIQHDDNTATIILRAIS